MGWITAQEVGNLPWFIAFWIHSSYMLGDSPNHQAMGWGFVGGEGHYSWGYNSLVEQRDGN